MDTLSNAGKGDGFSALSLATNTLTEYYDSVYRVVLGSTEAICPGSEGQPVGTEPGITRKSLVEGMFCLSAAILGVPGCRMNKASHLDIEPRIGGTFDLTDHDGKHVTERILLGRWTAVFFGYTFCPDICPTTLQFLASSRREMGEDAANFQIVFITVDPERDSPAALKAYLSERSFPRGVLGLTGTPSQIKKVEAAFNVTAVRTEMGTEYAYGHTASIYFMNPLGQFSAFLMRDIPPSESADQIREIMHTT